MSLTEYTAVTVESIAKIDASPMIIRLAGQKVAHMKEPDNVLGVGAALHEVADGSLATSATDVEIEIKPTLKPPVVLRLVTDPSAKFQSHRVCRRSRLKPEAPTPRHPYPLHANL
jgi:hypothetical protein